MEWAIDTSNEFGHILTCILTTTRGGRLHNMAQGLVCHYRDAGDEPPKVIYVDKRLLRVSE